MVSDSIKVYYRQLISLLNLNKKSHVFHIGPVVGINVYTPLLVR